ncbi:hypothetical protein XELAEV_18046269mg [Xenopus laevis]|uniref:Uncharacterized protein n=1 Tax=Xenopus laevis TaxID=8355 RepID=A0A974BSU2_XENLA|nr:hypothetical protein XELAEV_18046269mg [Xenopus laevis]
MEYQAWALICGCYLSYGTYLLALNTKHGHLPVDITYTSTYLLALITKQGHLLWVSHKKFLLVGINYQAWALTCGYHLN